MAFCISGQYAHAEHLSAGPVCTRFGDMPHRPESAERMQYTGVALKPGSPLTLSGITDLEALNLDSLDDGEVRDVRSGLDVTLTAGATSLRVLVVHLKSGCFDDRIAPDLWTRDPAGTAPPRFACDTLGRQLYPLRRWVEARETAGEAWLVAGDFNRRLDAGSGRGRDKAWKAPSGYAPDATGTDRGGRADISLYWAPYKKASECWSGFRDPDPASLAEADDYNILPIEFFVFRTHAPSRLSAASEQHVGWPHPVAVDKDRLSDHCPP